MAGLEPLAADQEKYVRRAVLRNPAVPAGLVEKLAKDPAPEVSCWAPYAD